MERNATSIVGFLSQDKAIEPLRLQLGQKESLALYGLDEGQRTLISAALLVGQEIHDLLVVCDTQKRAKELIDRAHQHAEAELESKNKQMQNMMLASFQKADHLVGIAEEVYTKQLAVIRQDRQEVLEILETLAQRKPK